ncbi:MAG: CPXCG motif-containing cysteine-rich protein [Thermoanaerobaculia bacterium]|nr:CPXCG motif-containing cysteine-rich protein [Thermoanaerobaculia bacterium]
MSSPAGIPIGRAASYRCSWCGEHNEVSIDPSGGLRQRLVEDCWVCCRPNVLELSLGADGDVTLTAARESD